MNKKLAEDFVGKSTSFTSKEVDLDKSTHFSSQIRFYNGVSLNATCVIEVSNDFDIWVAMPNTQKTLSGASGVEFYDLQTSSNYVRISITISGGSSDFELDWFIK